MEQKLTRLVHVTGDHLSYVNYFLSECHSREEWESKRFKLLQMSFIILNGINDLIHRVKATDFYEKFVVTKRNPAFKYLFFILHVLLFSALIYI